MQEAELKFTLVAGYMLEEFDFASSERESIGVDIDVGPKGVEGSNIFHAFFVTPRFMADPARAHDNIPAVWTEERKIIVSAIDLKPIQDALTAILEPSLALGWPECIDRLRINLLWEYEGMEPAAKFLPPWYPVETQETEEGLRSWIERYRSTTDALAGLNFTVIGVCRARQEMAILLHDGRIARAIAPEGWSPPSKDDPLLIQIFENVDELNRFIADDATDD